MKITMTSTDQITSIDDVSVRVWEGLTERGVKCKVFVHRLAVANDDDATQFDAELIETLPPDDDATQFDAELIETLPPNDDALLRSIL